jgi:hypothetical protein
MADYQGKLADLPAVLVHSCDGCGGTLFLDPSMESWLKFADSTFGVYTLCRKCQAAEDKREAGVTVQKGTRCVHRALPGGPFSDLSVSEVLPADDEHPLRVTVWVLGFGGLAPERVAEIEARCWPAVMRGRRTFLRSELSMKGL